MTIAQPLTSSPESGSWVFLTDGYMDVALIAPSDRNDQKCGLNHFGFTMEAEEKSAVLGRLKAMGIEWSAKNSPSPDYIGLTARLK